MNVGSGLSLELGKFQKQVNIRLKQMQDQDFVKRLWNKEEDLWIKKTVKSQVSTISMGWLDVTEKMLKDLPEVEKFCKSIRQAGFNQVLLLGMGGSSLTPLVFQKTFSNPDEDQDSSEEMKLTVLDSTDPATIKKIENEIDAFKTLFIVSSKSGNTAEVMAFFNYFYAKVYNLKGEAAGENFVAITDEDSPLVELADQKKFRKCFINYPDIGGRYSALSYFGIVPAALAGVNVKEILKRTLSMVNDCGPQVPASMNPGVILGAVIAELASQGYDKLTYLLPPSLSAFGLWLEQLLAESTGKNGKGILPVNGNPIMGRSTYGNDRLFFQLELVGKRDDIQCSKLKDFISLEYPLIHILMEDELDLGKEFFRWEIATAAAGAILGVNPFDQPNVQESKKCTTDLLNALEIKGELPEMEPVLWEDSITYFGPDKPKSFSESNRYSDQEGAKILLENFLQQVNPGDYISLQSYLPEDFAVTKFLSEIQRYLQKTLKVAVTREFGPRYLHSTGQYHKGGPNKSLFIQFIASPTVDIQIPNQSYSFGSLIKAQAMGDMQALIDSKRKVILVDLGEDYVKGLDQFKHAIEKTQPTLFNIAKRKNGFSWSSIFEIDRREFVQKNAAR